MITLQTANALLIIRCFTKYIIEIENETTLLEHMNYKPGEIKKIELASNLELKKNSVDYSTDSSATSPKRYFNPNKNYRSVKPKQNIESNLLDSQDNSVEFDSDEFESIPVNTSQSGLSKSDDILYLLIKNIFQICIEVPIK